MRSHSARSSQEACSFWPAAPATPEASASEAPEEAASTLTVWVDQERVDALKGAAEAYTEETGVDVELVGKDNATIKDDFIQQVPTGRGPDITMGAHDWLGELSTNGVVAPIELGDSAADYLDVAINASTYDGTVYMLPYAVENIAVLRNADIIAERGNELRRHDREGHGRRPRLSRSWSSRAPRATPTTCTRSRPRSALRCSAPTQRAATTPTDLQLGNSGGEAFADVARQPGQERHRCLQHRHRRRHRQGELHSTARRHSG